MAGSTYCCDSKTDGARGSVSLLLLIIGALAASLAAMLYQGQRHEAQTLRAAAIGISGELDALHEQGQFFSSQPFSVPYISDSEHPTAHYLIPAPRPHGIPRRFKSFLRSDGSRIPDWSALARQDDACLERNAMERPFAIGLSATTTCHRLGALDDSAFIQANLTVDTLELEHRPLTRVAILGAATIVDALTIAPGPARRVELLAVGSVTITELRLPNTSVELLIHSSTGKIEVRSVVGAVSVCDGTAPTAGTRLRAEAPQGISWSGTELPGPIGCDLEREGLFWSHYRLLL
ncbi:MAG: hypothetical protein KDD69_11060 [Bdellovibrionales bacterium]|nr:hypothetical protein [Bdellovibrionales bacterium]